jgi:hypothetical protein
MVQSLIRPSFSFLRHVGLTTMRFANYKSKKLLVNLSKAFSNTGQWRVHWRNWRRSPLGQNAETNVSPAS